MTKRKSTQNNELEEVRLNIFFNLEEVGNNRGMRTHTSNVKVYSIQASYSNFRGYKRLNALRQLLIRLLNHYRAEGELVTVCEDLDGAVFIYFALDQRLRKLVLDISLERTL
jgi:hypothetical protein